MKCYPYITQKGRYEVIQVCLGVQSWSMLYYILTSVTSRLFCTIPSYLPIRYMLKFLATCVLIHMNKLIINLSILSGIYIYILFYFSYFTLQIKTLFDMSSTQHSDGILNPGFIACNSILIFIIIKQ